MVALALLVTLALLSPRARADTAARATDFTPRLSSGAAAMEYWDVTAWLDSGHRFFARFLVTNQGPGVTTAAAVGHVVLPDGETLPFKWGRRAGAWTLGNDGRHLEIGKATLDLSGSQVSVTVASKKRGIDLVLALEIPARSSHFDDDYSTTIGMPGPARGRMQLRGAPAAVTVTGAGAVTQTWMERPEGEVVRRRLEAMARDGTTSWYVSDVALSDGEHRSQVLVLENGRLAELSTPALTLALNGARADRDGRYPVPTDWHARGTALDADVRLEREILRFDPLEILPQPFRLLLGLGGRPQRVWSEATVDLNVPGDRPRAAAAAPSGIVVATFAGRTAQ